MQQPQILAIKTTILNEVVFIEFLTRKCNGKLIPNYTSNPYLAHDFVTENTARAVIRRFVNPNNYQYTTITLPG